MASNDDDNDVLTVAALGGGALLAWLLLRGRRGLGGGGGNPHQASAKGSGAATTTGSGTVRPAGPPCRVWLTGRTIAVNGTPVDLPTMVRMCQAAGGASLGGAGDTIQGTLDDTVRALNRGGVPTIADEWLREPAFRALSKIP